MTEKGLVLPKAALESFLGKLSEKYSVYVPVRKNEQRFFKRYTGPSPDIVIGEVRPFEPLKTFFSRTREVVADGFSPEIPHSKDKPFAIVGVKACDLKGFKIQDDVFLGVRREGADEKSREFKDPFYIKNREQNFIVSADCTCAIETCFCTALGIKPHPEENFDLNFSEVSGGFVIEVGSDRGRIFVDENAALFQPVTDRETAEKDQQRVRVVWAVEENLQKNDIPRQESFSGIIERNYESPIWNEEAKTCVECGACTTICPTCHCFLLYDQKSAEKMERLRVWDSCMIKDYARVAGGGNPRARLFMRLRNRFEKKFDFFPKRTGIVACTGCGRCVSACPAKIDIRRILRKLVAHVS